MKRVTLLALCLAALVLSLSRLSRAQASTTRTQVSTRKVEVGEPLSLQFTVLVQQGDPTPSNPTLTLPAGMVAHGPTVSTQQQISLSGGKFFQRQGITATWAVSGARPGRYRVGPPSVVVAGRRVNGDVVEIEVVPAGAGNRQPNPQDPFSVFPNFPNMPKLPPLFGTDDDEPEPDLPNFPEELRVGQPDDPIAFLRAVAKPDQVVVGEQVTLRIFAYGRRGPFRETNTSEPSREAFVAHTLLENSYSETMYRVPISGDVWYAKKMREIALFPIQSGKLVIGAMRMGFEGRGYPNGNQNLGLARYSAPLSVVVTEPPTQGRPPGYKLGDVGRYTLSANVEPREITRGEAVSIVAKLEGTGNLPFNLRTPQQKGVTFLEPTTVEEIEPRGSTIGGWRKFTFVVRIDVAGDIDLGDLSLPYWDPDRASYETASTELGKIHVLPGSGASDANEAEELDQLEGALSARKSLGAPAVSERRLSDQHLFWLLLFAGPLAVVLGAGARSAKNRLSDNRLRRKSDQKTAANRAIADARRAAGERDAGKTASAIERAIFSAIEAATGRKMRAVLKSELASELSNAGLSSEMAEEVVRMLELCDDLRFTGAQDTEASDDLVRRAQELTTAVAKTRPRPARNGDDEKRENGEGGS